MDELDHILLDQLHSAQRRLKIIHRMQKRFYDPYHLGLVEQSTLGQIAFFESMIQDKTLLKKRKRKKQKKETDILDKNPVYTYYRNLYMFAVFMFNTYASLWYNNKKGQP